MAIVPVIIHHNIVVIFSTAKRILSRLAPLLCNQPSKAGRGGFKIWFLEAETKTMKFKTKTQGHYTPKPMSETTVYTRV